jgi:chromosome segregation ATPase
MNDLTKPSTLIAGVNTLGLVTAGIYFSRQNTTLNARVNDVTDEIETIKEGLKEKVPTIENSVRTLDHSIRFVSNSVQNVHLSNGKIDKKLGKTRDELAEISAALDKLDQRFVNLVEALIAKDIIKKEDVDPPSKVVTKTRNSEKEKSKKKSKHRRDETESEQSSSDSDSESEDDRHNRRDNRRNDRHSNDNRRDNRRPPTHPQMAHHMGNQSHHMGHQQHMPYPQAPQPRRGPQAHGPMNNDDDDIDVVARMASGRK